MTITAKFASTCTACKTTIAVGTAVIWTKGVQGVKHASLDACRTAAAHRQTQPAAAAAPVLDLSAVVAFLVAARDGANGGKPLKFPQTRFAAPGSGELQLSLAPLTGKNPGAVYVKLNGEYAGKVTATGAAYGLTPELVEALRTIAANPAAAGAAYGRLTGNCSFCTQGLSDEGSLEVGYGPKCAKNYGLPHKPRGSAKVTPVLGRLDAQLVGATYVGSDIPVLPSERAAYEAAQRRTDGDCDGTAEWNLLAAREEGWTL